MKTKITNEILENFRTEITTYLEGQGKRTYGKGEIVKLAEAYVAENGYTFAPMTLAYKAITPFKLGHGLYTIEKFIGEFDVSDFATKPKTVKKSRTVRVPAKAPAPQPQIHALPGSSTAQTAEVVEEKNYVPAHDANYIEDENFATLQRVFKSAQFFPVYISGPSGIGKTTGTEQACARLGRELLTVSVTKQTNEDDLLGGFRLVDGETKWFDGPVVTAMKRGAVLLLDEVDLASDYIMCLQPVLSGKSVFLKKINTNVAPAPGFTIVATANTKGQGDESGKFIGTGFLNEAFLDRFPVSLDADYPTEEIETQILSAAWEQYGKVNAKTEDTIRNLIKWANLSRKNYKDGLLDDVISTRRTVNIVQTIGIFKNVKTALTMVMNRFDEVTRDALVDLYSKVDATFRSAEKEATQDDQGAFAE